MSISSVLDVAPTPASVAVGGERALMMPRPGETVDAYLIRLRALQDQLASLIAAVERGALSRDREHAGAPVVIAPHLPDTPAAVAAAALPPAERAPLRTPHRPIAASRPGVDARHLRSVPTPGLPATGDRRVRENDRRGPITERRAGVDRRAGLPDGRQGPDLVERRLGHDRRAGARSRRIGGDRRRQPTMFERGGPELKNLNLGPAAWWTLQVLLWVGFFALIAVTLASR